MGIQKLASYFIAIAGFCMAAQVDAAVPQWQIIPAKSTLTFTATQNGSPASGRFKKFTGDIYFAADHLNESKVKIAVDMNSLATTYAELSDTLFSADWFDIKVFPQAVFTATDFKKTGDHDFTADGTLTIKDKSAPVRLLFTLTESSKSEVSVTGHTTLKRTVFGVGQGEWASTDEVKDDVEVNFALVATQK